MKTINNELMLRKNNVISIVGTGNSSTCNIDINDQQESEKTKTVPGTKLKT